MPTPPRHTARVADGSPRSQAAAPAVAPSAASTRLRPPGVASPGAAALAFALLATALLAAGCAGGPATSPTAKPARTTLPDLDQRSLLILMADQRRFDPLAIATAARGSTPLRRQAALTLGRVGDRRGVPVLDSLLADPDVGVREAAAFALGLLAERGHASARQALAG
ncbi:MAG: HEAT repeat domain-containing protein, partial [Acidobacteriota bacterium]